MDAEEYETKKQELMNENITAETVRETPTAQRLTDEDIDKMIAQSQTIISDEEKDKILSEDDEKEQTLEKFGGESLSRVPELSAFLKSEEHLRLGTNAKIPVPLEIEGQPFKVFIRPLSRKELIKCRNKAQNKGHNDVDYEAVLMVTTDSNGKPYTEEELNSVLGYGHIQTIAEAIIIASGESPENTQTGMRTRIVDEFLQKFSP